LIFRLVPNKESKSPQNETTTMKVQWVDERTGGPLATILGNATSRGGMGGLSSNFDIGEAAQPPEGLGDEFSMNSGDFVDDTGASNMADTSFGESAADTSFGESARDYSSMDHFFNASTGRDGGDFDFDPNTDPTFFDAEGVSTHSIDLTHEVIADRAFEIPGMEPSSGEETDSDIAHGDGEGSVFGDEPPGAVDFSASESHAKPREEPVSSGGDALGHTLKGDGGETSELDAELCANRLGFWS
jgi:hypothetical protein